MPLAALPPAEGVAFVVVAVTALAVVAGAVVVVAVVALVLLELSVVAMALLEVAALVLAAVAMDVLVDVAMFALSAVVPLAVVVAPTEPPQPERIRLNAVAPPNSHDLPLPARTPGSNLKPSPF